jgi:ATP-dependent Lon protease
VRFENEIAMRSSVPGVATGLAWTPVGGDILFIEATRVPGAGRLILTGQLGEVMKESAQAALSLVKGQSDVLGIDAAQFEKSDVHIHVPAGAIPKDGPSAGVAMFTALVSLLTGRTIRSDVAMTGEISLRGLVLPVGGIKEKTVAAHRAGIRTVLLPARNRKDLEDVPQSVRNDVEFAEGTAGKKHIGVADLEKILGPVRFENEIAMRSSVPGVATGLAWTPVGGDILFIEATRTPGGGKMLLTGQLGEVMRESAQAAYSLVKSMAVPLKIEPGLLEKSDIHVHVPAGATPKDGPSAGVAMFMALTSLFTGRVIRNDTAMTGEISLRGLVLPVGGIKEKVVAAAAAGITRVMLPARNKRDYDDIPEEVRNKLEFVWLEKVDDAVAAGLQLA